MVQGELENEHFLPILIENVHISSLIDTGASKSLISEAIALKINAEIKPLNSGDLAVLFSADGYPLPIIGKTEINLNISGLKMAYTVSIVRQLNYAFIMGCDLLKRLRGVVDIGRQKITFRDDGDGVHQSALYRSVESEVEKRPRYALAAETACISPFSEAIVEVKTPKQFNGQSVLMEPRRDVANPRFATARSLSQCESGRSFCRIFNYQPHNVTLHKGYKIAFVEGMNVIASCTPCKDDDVNNFTDRTESDNPQTRETLDKFLNEYKFKINTALTSEQKYQLLQTLWENKDVFARNLGELVGYPGYQFKIDLLTDCKAFKRQFRLSPEDNMEVQRQILEMERHNIIEKTENTEWNSPIFLVDKKDKSRRLVVDMRLLNKVVRPRLICLPRIPDLLEEVALKKASWLSSFDLFSGYHNVLIHPSSRDCTSFTSPVTGQRYRYRVLPFGLTTAPAAMCLIL